MDDYKFHPDGPIMTDTLVTDNELDYDGDNPNGWGWEDRPIYLSYVYRVNGAQVASITKYRGFTRWHGSFMGATQFYNEDLSVVFRAILTKLAEHGY